MRRLFLITVLILNTVTTHGAAQENGITKIQIGSSPELVASFVFVGLDSDMNLDTRAHIAIQPTFKDSQLLVPKSIDDALFEMKKMLPKWYQYALKKSTGEQECEVNINHNTVSNFIKHWIGVNWINTPEGEAIRKEYKQYDLNPEIEVEKALNYSFCQYVKTGVIDIEKALSVK
jgi:hypothetical protein